MDKVKSCPNCGSNKIKKLGFFQRKRNRQKVQRYLCRSGCGVSFSDQSLSRDYDHKRPDLNQQVLEMVSSGMGVRRMAKLLRTTVKTVQRKILFNERVCEDFHRTHMKRWKNKPRFQVDELQTFERRQGHTLKVPVIVEKDSHFIVDLTAIRHPSNSQYPRVKDWYNREHAKEIGKRADRFKESLARCREMKPEGRIVIESDKHKSYPDIFKGTFGEKLVHVQYNAKDEEDKKRLFPVNNTCACLRSDLAMLRKKTWHVGKSRRMVEARLKIYLFYHNYLNPKSYKVIEEVNGKKVKRRVLKTPAMHLGIFDRPVIYAY